MVLAQPVVPDLDYARSRSCGASRTAVGVLVNVHVAKFVGNRAQCLAPVPAWRFGGSLFTIDEAAGTVASISVTRQGR